MGGGSTGNGLTIQSQIHRENGGNGHAGFGGNGAVERRLINAGPSDDDLRRAGFMAHGGAYGHRRGGEGQGHGCRRSLSCPAQSRGGDLGAAIRSGDNFRIRRPGGTGGSRCTCGTGSASGTGGSGRPGRTCGASRPGHTRGAGSASGPGRSGRSGGTCGASRPGHTRGAGSARGSGRSGGTCGASRPGHAGRPGDARGTSGSRSAGGAGGTGRPGRSGGTLGNDKIQQGVLGGTAVADFCICAGSACGDGSHFNGGSAAGNTGSTCCAGSASGASRTGRSGGGDAIRKVVITAFGLSNSGVTRAICHGPMADRGTLTSAPMRVSPSIVTGPSTLLDA